MPDPDLAADAAESKSGKPNQNWERVLPALILAGARGWNIDMTRRQWDTIPRYQAKRGDRSWNHPAMGAAVGLALAILFQDVSLFLAAVSSLEAYREANLTIGYEGEEAGARTYGHMTHASLLVALRLLRKALGLKFLTENARKRATAMLKFLVQWHRHWWGRELACMVETAQGPRSLRCGARSQGHVCVIPSDYALSLTGRAKSPWVWVRGVNAFWAQMHREAPAQENTWCAIYDECKKEIVETSSDARPGMAGAPFLSLIEMRILETEAGKVVWCEAPARGEDSIPNNNTLGIAALGYEYKTGDFWALPPEGGADRVRSKEFVESCWRDGDTLHYEQTIAGGEPFTASHPLPAGPVLRETVYYRTGEVVRREGA